MLKNSALYGKTIQSPYKKFRYIIVRTEGEKNKYVSRADFNRLDTITRSFDVDNLPTKIGNPLE